MEQNKRIIRITRTAVFLALLIVLQAATAPLEVLFSQVLWSISS